MMFRLQSYDTQPQPCIAVAIIYEAIDRYIHIEKENEKEKERERERERERVIVCDGLANLRYHGTVYNIYTSGMREIEIKIGSTYEIKRESNRTLSCLPLSYLVLSYLVLSCLISALLLYLYLHLYLYLCNTVICRVKISIMPLKGEI